jgi:hypothetical protein
MVIRRLVSGSTLALCAISGSRQKDTLAGLLDAFGAGLSWRTRGTSDLQFATRFAGASDVGGNCVILDASCWRRVVGDVVVVVVRATNGSADFVHYHLHMSIVS